ncbi:hypothetical protein CPB86DRAFT_117471 [Serendipita vermifera]|nr:hypothetical protein CPB86DRAFT_117471 [Serendipita vermifera]
MQILTLFSLVHLLLLHPSLVYSSPSNGGALINSPAMKRAKVRSVVPRTLLQVGSAAANLDKRQTCGETCFDGSCCDVGYYCAVVQGVLGCCANGNTCTLDSGACSQAGYLQCNHYSFCCPINYACSLGPNNEETCVPPDGEVPPPSSSTPRPSSTTTRTTTTPTPTTPSATIVNNSGTSTSTNTNTNNNGGGGNTPIITNGAIGAVSNPGMLLMVAAASLAITFL